jgi:ornithine cyclodeaminase/alanine dehydrogenase-like protein (mu-crystallin family)
MTSRRSIPLSRRHFLRGAVAASICAPFVTSRSWAASPNGKVQVATFGAGGQGAGDLESFVRHEKFQLVAVADVDRRALEALKTKYATEFPASIVTGASCSRKKVMPLTPAMWPLPITCMPPSDWPP